MLYSILIKIKQLKIKRAESFKEAVLLFESFIRSDELFKKCIQYTYDTTKKYKIKKIPKKEIQNNNLSELEKIQKAFLFLDYLSQNDIVEKKIKNAFFDLVNQIPYGYEVFNGILKRSFGLYFGKSQVIKSCLGLCEAYPPLYYGNQINLGFMNYPVYAFDYYNYQYTRLFVIVKNKKVNFYSSKMRSIKLYNKIYKETFLKASNNQNMVFVCQALLKVNKYTDKRKKINPKSEYYQGIVLRQLFKKQISNKDNKNEMNNVEIHVENIISYKEFCNYKSNIMMKQQVNQNIWTQFPNNEYISTMKYEILHSEKELMLYTFNKLKQNIAVLAKWQDYKWKTGRSNQSMLLTKVKKCALNVNFIEYINGKKICHCSDKSNNMNILIHNYTSNDVKKSIPNDYTGRVIVYYCNVLGVIKKDEGKVKARLSYPYIDSITERKPTDYYKIIENNKVIKENLWNKKRKLMTGKKSYHHVKLDGIIETLPDK